MRSMLSWLCYLVVFVGVAEGDTPVQRQIDSILDQGAEQRAAEPAAAAPSAGGAA
jgi:hypothetical protein